MELIHLLHTLWDFYWKTENLAFSLEGVVSTADAIKALKEFSFSLHDFSY